MLCCSDQAPRTPTSHHHHPGHDAHGHQLLEQQLAGVGDADLRDLKQQRGVMNTDTSAKLDRKNIVNYLMEQAK